jgi:hypothetical protein
MIHDKNKFKNSLVFSVNNNAVPFTMKEIFVEYDNYILNSNDKTKLYNYLNTRDKVGNGHINFFPIIENNISKISAELNIKPNSKIYCLFTNLIWDSSVYGQDTIFNNMYEWIEETIFYFISNPTKHLIIRIHPAETRITWWKTRYTTADFINEMEIASKKDLKTFFKQWLNQPDNLKLNTDWKYDAKSKQITLNIKQIQSSGYIFNFPLEVEVFYADRINPEIMKFDISELSTSLAIKLNSKPTLIRLDPRTMLLAEINIK